jgi:hypothetical protein
MTKDEALKLATHSLAGEIIDALRADEAEDGYDLTAGLFGQRFSALVRRWATAELAQTEQEPVAWWDAKLGVFDEKQFDQLQPLYRAPPQREWVGLSMDELAALIVKTVGYPIKLAEGIEAALKEKNT